MLKKWFKKRRKGSKKHAETDPETTAPKTAKEDVAPTAKSFTRHGKIGSGRLKKTKPSSPARKSEYTNIEREPSRNSQPMPSTRSLDDKPVEILSINDLKIEFVGSPKASAPRIDEKASEVKNEVPLVRIRPIEGPKQRTSPRRLAAVEEKVDKIHSTSHLSIPIPPSPPTITSSTVQPLSATPSQVSERVEQPPPSPPPTDQFAHELGFLGVASPPSIDTALFASEEAGKGEGKPSYAAETDDVLESKISPPTLIEAVLPAKKVTNHKSRPEASVKSKSDMFHEMGKSRPYQDAEFFTATKSESGSGSKSLQIWLDEVKRSIDAHKSQTMTEFDRYHVGKGTFTEEKSEKDQNSASSNNAEALKQNIQRIDQALKETIEKSKAAMRRSTMGILKSKAAEAMPINDTSINERSGSEGSDTDGEEEEEEEEEELEEEEGEEDEEEEGVLSTDSHSSVDVRPIKIFSSSRRQKILDDTEDETTSVESQSSSSAYETLRQLNPTVSRDDTFTSNNSRMNFFSSKICNVGTIMDFEENLCHNMDDDDTIASNSTASKDSTINRVGGWMCFDAF